VKGEGPNTDIRIPTYIMRQGVRTGFSFILPRRRGHDLQNPPTNSPVRSYPWLIPLTRPRAPYQCVARSQRTANLFSHLPFHGYDIEHNPYPLVLRGSTKFQLCQVSRPQEPPGRDLQNVRVDCRASRGAENRVVTNTSAFSRVTGKDGEVSHR